MKSGILVVNKEKGKTSREVVNEVCRCLHTRHVGHTGTLDPLATGVLVMGVNEGCKVIELLTCDTKEYLAEVVVGLETDTLDITGQVLQSYNIEKLDLLEVKKVLQSFQGKYWQEVPKFSAIHVNGKRLYEYARNQEEVALPKREVEIYSIELVGDITKRDGYYHFSFLVHVSKGTYIRSLIRDIGLSLGYPCTMSNLTRTKQGLFTLQDCVELNRDKLELLPIEQALGSYPKLIVEDELSKKVRNGAILAISIQQEYVLMFNQQNCLLAIYQQYAKDKTKIKPYKVFGGMCSEEIK